MERHGRRSTPLRTMFVLAVVATVLAPLGVAGADAFATPAFAQQWRDVEARIPNFWGPLDTARAGQTEPYAEGRDDGRTGLRLVQYFDKARMELTTPGGAVTNGLLTVELKTGQMQFGDRSLQQLVPAAIGIAGDAGAPGPTYAALAQLPEREAQATGAVHLRYESGTTTFAETPPAPDPVLAFAAYLTDPGGRYGQNVPRAFVDYLGTLPGGGLPVLGYPISPAFAATVPVGGQERVVVVQAFERRVLTYTAGNGAGFEVEMGNIGQHYYQWRYSGVRPIPSVPPATLPVPAPVAADRLPESFGALYNGDVRVRTLLGPPVGMGGQGPGAVLAFERGRLIYSGDPDAGRGMMYPLYGGPASGETAGYSRGLGFGVEWDATRPEGGGPGLYEPKRAFNAFWRLFAGRDRLGYATAPDATRFALSGQTFQRGVMLSAPDGQGVYVLWRENLPNGAGGKDRYELFSSPPPNAPAPPTMAEVAGRVAALYDGDARVRGLLGSAQGAAMQGPGATLAFEHGRMLSFRAGVDVIAVLCGDDPDAGQVFVSSRLTPYFVDMWSAEQANWWRPRSTAGTIRAAG